MVNRGNVTKKSPWVSFEATKVLGMFGSAEIDHTLNSQNDGRCWMNMKEIRERAATVGLVGFGKLRKTELVHSIQQAEGNAPCFGTQRRQQCAEMHCCWRQDCLKE